MALDDGMTTGAELTRREWDVLKLFSLGATYAEVARFLAISINTVRQHVRNLYEKLHVCSKTEAVMKAFQLAAPEVGLPARLA